MPFHCSLGDFSCEFTFYRQSFYAVSALRIYRLSVSFILFLAVSPRTRSHHHNRNLMYSNGTYAFACDIIHNFAVYAEKKSYYRIMIRAQKCSNHPPTYKKNNKEEGYYNEWKVFFSSFARWLMSCQTRRNISLVWKCHTRHFVVFCGNLFLWRFCLLVCLTCAVIWPFCEIHTIFSFIRCGRKLCEAFACQASNMVICQMNKKRN